ncbi:MAG: hypothetical protein ABI534_02370 [Chloroflexota bacterium]
MVRRYVVGGLLLLAVVVGLMLVVRPLIFSVADPRDDSRVAIMPQVQLSEGSALREVVLATSHGLDGEQVVDGRPIVAVVVSPLPGGVAAVVNATPPGAGTCRVEIGADRLRGCGGSWTYAGDPIDADAAPLQRFPVTLRDGAVYVDLTAPAAAGDGA